MKNPKSETLNSKQTQNKEIQNLKEVLSLENLNFEFI
jgi:hypothetical protein